MVHTSAKGPVPSRIEALERVLEMATLLAEGMEADAAGRGLTVARAEVVWLLHRRGPMRQRDLADALGVTPRNVTGLLDGLEATGFVARARHPSDRRATLVQLTPMGHATADALSADQEEFAGYLFDGFGEGELSRLVRTVDRLLNHLRDHGYADIRHRALERWATKEIPAGGPRPSRE
ncbi:MAG: MarR family winged helix-turn-helix transcriptional regulator [Acidimicrobiales bacterium]